MDVQRTIALKNVEEFQKAQASFEVAQKDQNSESTR